ncbi:Hypothetical predicted protein [Mytilus galloprovincialis]|uniref:Uncharacterized protein n=1 Tax=Mytilus galloprovincialis TaxID=29158 RepID=A0A8B6BWW1_MYTGA|nr:Hypothetical predicted protein [Mytilus galloprovincialis]
MKDLKHEIDSYIPYFTEEENKLQEKYNTGQNTYQNNKDTISNITDDIMKYSKKLQSQLDKQWMPAKNLIYAELLNVRNIKGELVKRKHNLEQTLTSPNASDVLAWTRDLDETMPDKNVRQFEFKPTQFKPGRIATDTLKDSFGAVCGAPYFRMVDSYETCLKSINKLVMCDNDSAFIGSYDEKLLVKITFKHRAVKVDTRVPNLSVYDMAMMNNGDLLISTQTKDLNLYTKEGVLNIFKSFPHNITLGVHVSQCDEISVGLGRSDTFVDSLKPYAYYKHNPNFDPRIEIMNLKGDTMHIIKYSDNSIYPS